MQFQLRMAGWTAMGVLQQALLFVVTAVVVLMLTGIVLGLLGSLGLRALMPITDRQMDRLWAVTTGDDSASSRRYPPVSATGSAGDLETVAATMGIDLAPATDPRRSHPDRAAAAAFEAVQDPLLEYIRRFAAGDDSPSTEPILSSFRAQHGETLAKVVDIVLAGEPPRWANDSGRNADGPDTNLRGQLWLQRVLASEAGFAIDRGEPAAATRVLEAAWRLNQGLLDCPQLAAQRTAIAALELELAVLRGLPTPPPEWQDRLRAFDLQQQLATALHCEALRLRHSTDHVLVDRYPALGFFVQPLARALAVDHNKAMLFAVSELPDREPVSFDPDAFFAELAARIPRWNTLARSSLPADWSSWPRTVRATLAVDLSIRVLALRDRSLREGQAAFQELESEQPSPVEGLGWSYRVAKREVAIALVSDPFPEFGELPLSATLRLGNAKGRGR